MLFFDSKIFQNDEKCRFPLGNQDQYNISTVLAPLMANNFIPKIHNFPKGFFNSQGKCYSPLKELGVLIVYFSIAKRKEEVHFWGVNQKMSRTTLNYKNESQKIMDWCLRVQGARRPLAPYPPEIYLKPRGARKN